MGMYDDLRCHYPLPVAGANALDYQTKDLRCFMDRYEIREDGTLWHQDYDVEDRSDPDAEGLMRLAGMMARVNQRWVQERITGEVRFYDWLEPDGWIEWSAYFVDGTIKWLHFIEHTPELPRVLDAAVDLQGGITTDRPRVTESSVGEARQGGNQAVEQRIDGA